MKTYTYKVIRNKIVVNGSISSFNLTTAIFLIKSTSIQIIKINRCYFIRRWSNDTLITWVSSLMVLMSNGLSITMALRVISENDSVSKEMSYFLDKGECFSQVLQYYDHIFPSSFTKIVEVMIKFTDIRSILNFFLNFNNKTKVILFKGLKNLYTPLLSMFLSIILLLLLLVFGGNMMESIHNDIGIVIPKIYYMRNYIHFVLFVFPLLYLFFKTKYKLPVIKQIYFELHKFLFFSFLGEAIANGIRIDEAIKLVDSTLPSSILNTSKIYEAIMSGEDFYKCCQLVGFSKHQSEIIRIYEKAGDLLKGIKISADISECNFDRYIKTIVKIVKLISFTCSVLIILFIFKFGFMSTTDLITRSNFTM